MIPTSNHIYSCTWEHNGDTYLNLITDVTSTNIIGRCVSSTDSTYFDVNPEDSKHIEWDLSFWKNNESTIIDLGHIDNFPELLI